MLTVYVEKMEFEKPVKNVFNKLTTMERGQFSPCPF